MHIEGIRPKQSKALKIMLLSLSLLFLSIVLESFIIAVLVLIGIFIHETGHLKAAEYLDIKHRGIYFLPGLGAVALINEIPKNRAKECFIALAGPCFGAIYSLALAMMFVVTGFQFLALGAFYNAFINLFNLLIPIDPLDGGRVIKSMTFSIHPVIGKLMLICSIILSFYLAFHGMILFWLVGIAGIYGFIDEIKNNRKRPKMRWFDIGYSFFGTIAIAILLIISFVIGGSGRFSKSRGIIHIDDQRTTEVSEVY